MFFLNSKNLNLKLDSASIDFCSQKMFNNTQSQVDSNFKKDRSSARRLKDIKQMD